MLGERVSVLFEQAHRNQVLILIIGRYYCFEFAMFPLNAPAI